MGFAYGEVKDGLRRAYDAKVGERDDHATEAWKIEERAQFLARLRAEDIGALLDIGSGPGVHAEYFADEGLAVTCVDLSPAMAQRCRDRGFVAYEQDVLGLDLPRRFGAAFAMNSLLHIPPADLGAALERIRGVLEPGALFYLGQYGGNAFEGPYPSDHYEPKRYFSCLTDEHLRTVVADVFTIVDFHPVDVGADHDFGHFQAFVVRAPA